MLASLVRLVQRVASGDEGARLRTTNKRWLNETYWNEAKARERAEKLEARARAERYAQEELLRKRRQRQRGRFVRHASLDRAASVRDLSWDEWRSNQAAQP